MHYIPTVNYLCTRSNGDICARIIDECTSGRTRKELGKVFAEEVDSSKMSRLLASLQKVGILRLLDSQWHTDPRIRNNPHGFPFRIVPIDGVSAEIMRLFGSQFIRGRRTRHPSGEFHVAQGPRATLTIKSLHIVLGVSREVLQLQLSSLIELGLLTRNTQRRPYTYELKVSNPA